MIESLEFTLDVHAFNVFYSEVWTEQYLIDELLEVLHCLVVISIEPVNELIASTVGEWIIKRFLVWLRCCLLLIIFSKLLLIFSVVHIVKGGGITSIINHLRVIRVVGGEASKISMEDPK